MALREESWKLFQSILPAFTWWNILLKFGCGAPQDSDYTDTVRLPGLVSYGGAWPKEDIIHAAPLREAQMRLDTLGW